MWPPLYGGGFLAAFVQSCASYYGAAIIIHFVIPVFFTVTSVQKGCPKQGQALQEALTSLGPLAVKAAVWTAVDRLHAAGVGLLYAGPIATPGAGAYALATVVALDYLHDAWFYWTHRLLHWSPLYKRVHARHHRSTVPTAFCGYSFHVVEAAIVFANEVLVCFLLPVHVGLHRAYHMYTTLIHCGGHAGYEVAPFTPTLEALVGLAVKGARAPAGALNTVMHHDMHHRHPKVHFSLYMTHWDRLCGTEHPQYRAMVAEHFGQSGSGKRAAVA